MQCPQSVAEPERHKYGDETNMYSFHFYLNKMYVGVVVQLLLSVFDGGSHRASIRWAKVDRPWRIDGQPRIHIGPCVFTADSVGDSGARRRKNVTAG